MSRRNSYIGRASVVAAVGVAMPTLLFAVIHAVVLSDLPLPRSGRVGLLYSAPDWAPRGRMGISGPNLKDLLGRSSSVELAGAFTMGVWAVPVQLPTGVVYLTAGEFDRGMTDVLGIRPVVGRWPADDELRAQPPRVALVSERFWRERLGADPSAAGKTVLRVPYPVTIAGVLPAMPVLPFLLKTSPDLIFASPTDLDLYGRDAAGYQALVRLRPGASLTQLRAELAVRARQLRAAFPGQTKRFVPQISPLRSAILGRSERLLWLLFAATGVVWLIAAANFAALLAVRLEERRAELAIRAALGAGSRHLLYAAAQEVLRSALVGVAAGFFVAWAGVRFMQTHAAWFDMPRLADARLDLAAMLFGASTALLASAAALLLNASRSLRASPAALVHGGFLQRLSLPTRFAEGIIAAQFCLALVVANTAAVTGHSLARMEGRPLGYDPRQVLAMRISLSDPASYLDRAGEQRDIATTQAILDFASTLPGVQSATAAYPRPGVNMYSPTFNFAIAGSGSRPTPALKRDVFPDYFQVMRVPLVRGRAFLATEDPSSHAAVVNQAFAHAYFGAAEPLGRELYWGSLGAATRFRIVGVAADSVDSLSDAAPPTVYLPGQFGVTDLLIRTAGETRPAAIANQVARFVGKLDPSIVVSDTQTLESAIQQPLAQAKTQTLLSAAFALVSLLLAASGLYGVTRYAGETRRRDYAIRVALGATAGGLTRARIYRTLGAVACGLTCGLAGSAICGKIVESMLFGVPAIDPPMLASASGVLLLTGLAASYASVRDTAAVEPADLLRSV